MKIAILSCFYPYRGGIAQFNANLYNELSVSHEVRAFNFKKQYPDVFFPGRSQYVTEVDSTQKIESTPLLNTANPLSFVSSAGNIRRWEPEMLLMRYWMPYFAPSQGYVGRHQLKKTKVISILDNVLPHERRVLDTSFTKYYLKSNDGFIVLSDAVGRDLLELKPDARYITIPHPLYNHFGEKIERRVAMERLGLNAEKKTLLFFGLIREYKGLDILIDAFSTLDESYQLIIAGEPYGSFSKYETQMRRSPAKERIAVYTQYIPDHQVPLFFSASDVVVLPYRSATQSGISAISSHFGIPMITTNVGGLKEAIERPGTGIVVDAIAPEAIAKAIIDFFNDPYRNRYVENIEKERDSLSWAGFANKLINFYHSL